MSRSAALTGTLVASASVGAGKRKVPFSSRRYQGSIPSPVPVEDLQPVAASIAEDEQVAAERVLGQDVLDQLREPVEPSPHVGRLPGQEDADGGGQAQHRRASSTERTASRVGGSKPRGTRTVGPAGSTISIGAASGDESGSSGTTCTGRKAERRTRSVEGLGAVPAVGRGLVIASGQLPPPPAEGPGLQALAAAEFGDREAGAGLLGDRPPPGPFPGRIAWLPRWWGHGAPPRGVGCSPRDATRPRKMAFA